MLIRGKTIELRAIESSDCGWITDILLEPSVSCSLFGFPDSAASMGFENWLAAARGRSNCCYFAAAEKASGQPAGVCAYQDIHYRNGSVTVWMALRPGYGRGAELLSLLAAHAFDQLRMDHISVLCLSTDTRTAACAEQAGFTRDATFYSRVKKDDKRFDLSVYTLLKGEGGDT